MMADTERKTRLRNAPGVQSVPGGVRCYLAGLLLAASCPCASAFQFDLGGGLKGSFDSTLSYGVEMRMQSPSCGLIGLDNGGCAGLSGALPESSPDATALNTDDGDLNYHKHDLVSQVIKGTHELELKMPDNWSFFGRISELYDWRIGETERTQLAPEARRYSVYNVQPLDAYLNKDFTWLDRSAHIRVGSQVISWGEDVFVIGGINSVNAYDLRHYHVAGAQVKEILRPAPIVALSTDLLPGWSAEAYYQWHWNGFQLDPVGTYFSNYDVVGRGYDGAIFIPTSLVNAQLQANPEAKLLLAAGVIHPLPYGTLGDPGGTGLTTAQLEQAKYVRPRIAAGFEKGGTPPVIADAVAALVLQNMANPTVESGTAIPLVADAGGSNHGQYGLSFRYHPEWIDASFGFYYERYNAKIPYITYTVGPSYATDNPASAAYKIEYPGGIQLFGVSYNSQLAESWSIGGELSWRPKDPVGIDPTSPSGQVPNSAAYACVSGGGEASGKYCRGWVDRAKLQVQQSALQLFSPNEGVGGWILQNFGAREGYFIGEVGATLYPGLAPLGGIPWSLPNYSLPSKFSAGYIFETQLTYPNVLNLGLDWLPQVDWSQGVVGNSPNALPWQQGVKSATATLGFKHTSTVTGAVAYNWFWGGGAKNQNSDRDYLSLTIAYNF